jgi:hypothetical protein
MNKRSDTDISQRGSVLSQPQMTAAGSPGSVARPTTRYGHAHTYQMIHPG